MKSLDEAFYMEFASAPIKDRIRSGRLTEKGVTRLTNEKEALNPETPKVKTFWLSVQKLSRQSA